MEKEPFFEDPAILKSVEEADGHEAPSEQLRPIIESLGFVESSEMADIRGGLVAEWSLEAESKYHMLGEVVANEATGANGQISLILQMARVQIEAGQMELAMENLDDALDYADNMGNEELGDQIYAIKKMLITKSSVDGK